MKLIYNSAGRIIATAVSGHIGDDCIDAPAEWDGNFDRWRVVDGGMVAGVPEVVTPRQAKIALLQAGLLDDVEAGIEALEDQGMKRLAQIEWEYAQEVRRDWPLLNTLAAGMGITDAQLDELFRVAAGV
jgi:hypothetical protein